MSAINLRVLFLATFSVGSIALSAGQTSLAYSDLHDFGGIARTSANAAVRDGGNPMAAVVFDAAGNMYGTTTEGGLYGKGSLWKLSPQGKYTVLHEFGGKANRADGTTGPDGMQAGSIVIDKYGVLYGYATLGGYFRRNSSTSGFGMLWKFTTNGVYTDIHDFGDVAETSSGLFVADGAGPTGLTIDHNGNLFGITVGGGLHEDGIVFELAKNNVYTDIHDFGGYMYSIGTKAIYDGFGPDGITIDASGNLFGVTAAGGLYGGPGGWTGIVWELSASGQYTDLHDFGGTVSTASGTTAPDGTYGLGNVAIDGQGNLYGVTGNGGTTNQGVIWKLTANHAYSLVYQFTELSDGVLPFAGLVADSTGNLFGTTYSGGALGGGTVYELTNNGTYKDLHDFGGNTAAGTIKHANPRNPAANLTIGPSGYIYGTASQGGPDMGALTDGGGLFEINAK